MELSESLTPLRSISPSVKLPGWKTLLSKGPLSSKNPLAVFMITFPTFFRCSIGRELGLEDFFLESFQLYFANADVWLHIESPRCRMIYDPAACKHITHLRVCVDSERK